ncbi:hypothetical protein [Cryptosporangium japonicum]|uniref:SWIM-type domain-containing protein n=1 Tax=Cryptosporangium japonicum TaxID=80872 RepID=A0ABN0UVE1_9ACTN
MSALLPPVDGVVLADAVDALPGRLRKRLDGAVAKVASYEISVDGPEWTVRIDDSTVVTLRTVDGAVRTSDDARCTCLLAPACLHRAATLAAAPTAEAADEAASDPPTAEAVAARPDAAAAGPVRPAAGADPDGTGAAPADLDGAAAAGPAPVPTGAADPTKKGATAARPERDGGVDPARPAAGRAGVARSARPAAAAAARDAAESGRAESGRALNAAQVVAVDGVWSAAGAVLAAGVTGSGAVLRAALLRAAHEARAHGLHHLAAGARQVAAHLHDARTAAPQYRLATLADDLRELLLLAHRLRGPAIPAEDVPSLLGTARREYTPRGSLRLHGLCTVPVLARSGHAGTATYAADRDGVLWLVADIYPGDAQRAATTVDAAIPVGEGALSHRQLARTGLLVTGATASASRQLGAGRGVRAVRAGGVSWTEGPLAALWDTPVESQLDRAFAALRLPVQDRPTGDDLLFLRVEPIAPGDGGVVALTADDRVVTLVAALDHPALAYRDNLRVLAAAAGVPLLLIGRPDPAHPGHVQALALAPAPSPAEAHPATPAKAHPATPTEAHPATPTDATTPAPPQARTDATPPADPTTPTPDPTQVPDGSRTSHAPHTTQVTDEPVSPALRLPADWGGHADLGYDRLHPSMITANRSAPPPDETSAAAPPPTGTTTEPPPARVDPALELLRRHLDRAVDGGRAVHALARSDQHVLRRARWDTGADLLAALEAAARPGTRDVFGRLADDDGRRFVLAWLAAAVYEQTAAWTLSRAAWSPDPDAWEAPK